MIPTMTARIVLVAVVLAAACTPPDAGRPDYRLRSYLKVLAAEDTRHTAGANLELLVDATHSPDAFIRLAGVRAMGRAEAPELLAYIEPLLQDEEVEARAESANAMAQAVHKQPGEVALESLMDRLGKEENPGVIGVIARSIGRLSLNPEERREVGRVLVRLSRGPDGGDAPCPQLVGVLLGMDSFVRGARGAGVGGGMTDRLRELISHGLGEVPQTLTMVRLRTIAVTALGAAGGFTVYQVEASLRDPGEGTRRAAAALLNVVPEAARSEFIRRLLRDPSPQVRLEGVRAIARDSRDEVACTRLLAVATREMTAGVRAAALDALSEPCPDTGEQLGVLTAVASTLEPGMRDWHEPAHALVSLAALAPTVAASLVPDFARHGNPFVRSYAAQAAGRLGDVGLLRSLAEDDVANVQTAALVELANIEGGRVDPLLISTIERADDPQLLLTAAGLLAETELHDQAASAALATMERLSERRQQTLRDARVALLTLIGRVGQPSLASDIEPYVRDSDRRIADLASEILGDWTGDPYISAPRVPDHLPLPTQTEMEDLLRTSVVLYMATGGAITIELQPYGATTNVFRFVNMARDGAFDGLTLHRIAANFVAQGGSPGANEHAGHGAFTRDEVGLPVQWRGTVGISTRGRDTGDGQIYVNLVDNVRLDHDYTIIGAVTRGMEVVDAVMEGDIIARVEVRTGN